jgi:hypothetical protein
MLSALGCASSDRDLTAGVAVESWHRAARIVCGWHAGRVGCPWSLNRVGDQLFRPPGGGGGLCRHRSVRGVGGVGVVSARGSKPFACAVFPVGTLHRGGVKGKRMAARAQADVMRFSMLAAGSRTRQGWPGLFRRSD